jgi:hypothetical protein
MAAERRYTSKERGDACKTLVTAHRGAWHALHAAVQTFAVVDGFTG